MVKEGISGYTCKMLRVASYESNHMNLLGLARATKPSNLIHNIYYKKSWLAI
jgi:hypothetical protein